MSTFDWTQRVLYILLLLNWKIRVILPPLLLTGAQDYFSSLEKKHPASRATHFTSVITHLNISVIQYNRCHWSFSCFVKLLIDHLDWFLDTEEADLTGVNKQMPCSRKCSCAGCTTLWAIWRCRWWPVRQQSAPVPRRTVQPHKQPDTWSHVPLDWEEFRSVAVQVKD